MSKAKNSTEVLIAAKWILENVGWCQGLFTKRDVSTGKIVAVCAVQAINLVEKEHSTDTIIARHRVMDNANYHGLDGNYLTVLNDDSHTTKEKVLLAFERAIEESGYE